MDINNQRLHVSSYAVSGGWPKSGASEEREVPGPSAGIEPTRPHLTVTIGPIPMTVCPPLPFRLHSVSRVSYCVPRKRGS